MKNTSTVTTNLIPIVASADDNYAYPVCVMFVSLLENTSNPERFHLFIIDGGISDLKKEHLTKEIDKRRSLLSFLDVNTNIYDSIPNWAHCTTPAYYRISIPHLFAKEVTRVIYLDCDLIIKDDLQTLWEYDLNGCALGAVENISSSTFLPSGLKQEDYFNSGVLLIDLHQWREQTISEKVVKLLLESPKLLTNDQTALNLVFNGKWQRLPLQWNHQSGIYRKSSQIKRLEQSSDFERALWSPSIIHFIGWAKPWLSHCYHPLAAEYLRYRSLCSFIENHPIKKNESVIKQKRISLWKKRLRQLLWQRRYRQKGYSLVDGFSR